MSDPKNKRLTAAERKTEELMRRFDNHTELWWQRYADKKEFSREYNAVVDDKPHELWRCEFSKINAEETEETEDAERSVWFLWDGKQVTSYDTLDVAIVDFVTEKKEERIKSKIQYITSPLAISAIMALLLGILIFVLMVWRNDKGVPDQLWTIFTAVIAFYFGRKDTRASSAD